MLRQTAPGGRFAGGGVVVLGVPGVGLEVLGVVLGVADGVGREVPEVGLGAVSYTHLTLPTKA